jgi:hypothetical protein
MWGCALAVADEVERLGPDVLSPVAAQGPLAGDRGVKERQTPPRRIQPDGRKRLQRPVRVHCRGKCAVLEGLPGDDEIWIDQSAGETKCMTACSKARPSCWPFIAAGPSAGGSRLAMRAPRSTLISECLSALLYTGVGTSRTDRSARTERAVRQISRWNSSRSALRSGSFTTYLLPPWSKGSGAGPSRVGRWARLVSNQRPLACEASALPLSYAPGCGDCTTGRGLRQATRPGWGIGPSPSGKGPVGSGCSVSSSSASLRRAMATNG